MPLENLVNLGLETYAGAIGRTYTDAGEGGKPPERPVRARYRLALSRRHDVRG